MPEGAAFTCSNSAKLSYLLTQLKRQKLTKTPEASCLLLPMNMNTDV